MDLGSHYLNSLRRDTATIELSFGPAGLSDTWKDSG